MHVFTDLTEAMEVADAKRTLVALAAETGATVEFCKGCTCVNVHTLTGCSMWTASYCTLLDNIQACAQYIAECTYRVPSSLKEFCRLYDEGMY